MRILNVELGEAVIIEDLKDLPWPKEIHSLYLDAETTSFDDASDGAFDPYATPARACGWAVTWDDHPRAYYVPIRHRAPGSVNLPLQPTLEWLRHLVTTCDEWVNHNVKFDAHFLYADGVEFDSDLVCTVVLAKMLDSDKFGHGLKPLSREWLGLKMEDDTEREAYLKGIKSKDWGRTPVDLLGKYACMDVLANRKLYHYIMPQLPEDMGYLLSIERRLTPVLFDMERVGVMVDQRETMKRTRNAYVTMLERGDDIKRLTDVEFIDSNECFFEILCNRLGLPVLGWTKGGDPSFDAELLELYVGHPKVVTNAKAAQVLPILKELRDTGRLIGLFLEPFARLSQMDGRLHANFNQLVRTGRTSCSNPNLQQASKFASELIVPGEGRSFMCGDGNQMEFRIIVHYCGIEKAIAAYRDNPETDFHQFTTDMMLQLIKGIDRAAGKQTNFMVSYGGGKKKITQTLMANPDVMRMLPAGLSPEEYERHARIAASAIYTAYHEAMPEIKRTSQYATDLCRQRGFIRNKYGRRRHLPNTHAHKAFNAMIQGCASDIAKERMVEMSPRHNRYWRERDARMLINKHDEIVVDCPTEVLDDPGTMRQFKHDLEDVKIEFDVPIVFDTKSSPKNWREAKP